MVEFCDPEAFKVIVASSPDNYREFFLKDLLPFGFSPNSL
jgi:cytidine deaminase